MTVRFTFQPARETDSKATVVVQETLLAVEIWPDVPMTRKIEESLTVLDRLIIEAAIALDPAYPIDIEEITGIPQSAIVTIFGRLVRLGLLEAREAEAIATESGQVAVKQTAVARLRPTQMTLLYLADTDELIALPQNSGRRAPRLDRAEPAGYVDVDRGAGLTPRHEIIADRIRRQTILGLPKDIVAAVPTDDLVPEYSPQYRSSGRVETGGDGSHRARLKVDVGATKTVNLLVPHADNLARRWAELAEQAAYAADGWGLVAAEYTGRAWRYELGHEAAVAAATDGIRLGHPGGLLIQGDRDVVYIDVEFTPGDSSAARIFALQHAMAEAAMKPAAEATYQRLTSIVEASATRYGLAPGELTPAHVRSALWTARHYQHVYALRREGDFPLE
ncbi:helix-turn-helix domain-containing protein [Micromonospora sp. C95]|uniref:MarR family transcriptional regulator n=1 Tax=Micromonospora sp. C95 TaxID=2824882 RepID=UPI001B371955|nr:helix-turn-helix domain-containing protein [Micromonospora sp. C95]MBQ1026130.1 hypothetical protein [Micromonospora sp. C95]